MSRRSAQGTWRRADGEPLRPTGRLTPQQAQAAQALRLEGDVDIVEEINGDKLVPIIVGSLCGYYVLEKHKVLSGKDEYTPTGFETLAGKSACRKWRLSLRVWMDDGARGKTLGQWLADRDLEHTVPQPGKRKQAGELQQSTPQQPAPAASPMGPQTGGKVYVGSSPYMAARPSGHSLGQEVSSPPPLEPLQPPPMGSPAGAAAHHYYLEMQRQLQQRQQGVEVGAGDEGPVTPLTALLNAYFAEQSEGVPPLRPGSQEKTSLLALLQEELPSHLPPHLQPPIVRLPIVAPEQLALAGSPTSGLSLGSLGTGGLDSLVPAASWPSDLIKMPPELAVSDAGIAALARSLPDIAGEPPVQALQPEGRLETPAPSPDRRQQQAQAAFSTPLRASPLHQLAEQQHLRSAGVLVQSAEQVGQQAAGQEELSVQQLSELRLHSPCKSAQQYHVAPAHTPTKPPVRQAAPMFNLQAYAGHTSTLTLLE